MAVLTRPQAVEKLYNDTLLPPTTIIGAFEILDKSGRPLTPDNVAASAWSAYKAYETAVTEKASDFHAILGNCFPDTDLVASEIDLLSAVGWTVPPRTRLDCVDELARKVNAGSIDYARAALLSLIIPECQAMTNDQYARVVLCAAVLINKTADVAWTRHLATKDIGRDYIVHWATEVAEVAGPPSPAPPSPVRRGVKRKRE